MTSNSLRHGSREHSLRRIMFMLLTAALMTSLCVALVAKDAEASNKLTISPSSVDYGEATIGDTSPVKDVTLTNNGKKAITISPTISGPDKSNFSVSTDPITIQRRKSAVVKVTFTPSGSIGAKTGSLQLKDKKGNTAGTVPLKGTVKSPLEATPSTVTFDAVIAGDTAAQPIAVSLKNNGTQPLTISTSISGPEKSDFSASPASLTINPGDTQAVTVTFTPPGAPGSSEGILNLTDADGNLLGAMPLFGTVKPIIEANPSALDFGTVSLCFPGCPQQQVNITNNGTASVTISPSLSGPNADNFFVSTKPITIAAGDTQGVAVSMVPHCPNAKKTASLDLKDADGNTVAMVALQGEVSTFCAA